MILFSLLRISAHNIQDVYKRQLFFLVGSQQHAVEDGVEVHQVVRQGIRTVVADVQVGARCV